MNGPLRPASIATDEDILIVGGYGAVGQRIARLLIDEPGPGVIVGGRHRKRAHRVASELGRRAQARTVDVTDPATFEAALDGVGLVVVCVDTGDLTFAHACIARGIHIVDISASSQVIERLGYLDDLARAHGAVIVRSVGLSPGLTGLMAKACTQIDALWRLDIHLLFGLGDHHGAAAVSWMAHQLAHPFTVITDDGPREEWPFQVASRTTFPAPFGKRATYRFEFPDQTTLPAALGVNQVHTWSTCDRAGAASTLSWLAQKGVLRWLDNQTVRGALVAIARRTHLGSDRFAVSVEGTPLGREAPTLRITASGYEEAHATAVMATQTVRRVMADAPPPGAHSLEQLYDLTHFETALADHHIVVERHWQHMSDDGGVAATSNGPLP